jgi:aminomethyltransferase
MSESLKRTPLYDAHRALGAKLVPFVGFEMPVQYPAGIIAEHKAVRTAVGIFDVSHMGEVVFRGPRAAEAVQRLVANAAAKLPDGGALYTPMCYEDAGIVDDCIVYRRAADDYLVIINASNIDKDFAWMHQQTKSICEPVNESDDWALIAVQGPKAAALLDRIADKPFSAGVGSFHLTATTIAGAKATAARTGYTGEDGFEVMIRPADATKVWNRLLEAGKDDGILPCGLGSRDTLRLEARLCLYGNDIDQTTNPLEAGIGWTVKWDGDFIGKAALQAIKAKGLPRKLAGFVAKGRGIPRHGYPILDREGGKEIGKCTSGGPAPHLGTNIGLGYVPSAFAEPGTTLWVDCRGKHLPVEVVKGAFYKRSQG